MANDKVAIWNGGLKFGRAPINGELLIGDGIGFNLASLTAGSGVTITPSAGGITIDATGSGGTVTSVTATAPLSSTGGTAPDISLGTVGADKGGTGQTSLTLNNVLLGNGASAVQFVAPGTNGNVLTSNGTTWVSSAPAGSWTLLKKAANQSVTASTTLVNVTSLTFSMEANKTYAIRSVLTSNNGAGGIKISVNGTTAATSIRFNGVGSSVSAPPSAVQSYASPIFQFTGGSAINLFSISGVIQNGASASTLSLTFAQSSASGTTTIEKGSYLEYAEIA